MCIRDRIKEKNERLSTIIEKIELSKKEYDEIIGKIIESKKELRSQNNSDSNTNQKTEAKTQDIDKISKEISESKTKLKEIQEEILKNSKINEELEQRKKELEVLKKRLLGMKNSDMKNDVEGDSKSVVEAASQIVATTNKRLQDTMKELDVIRQLLDKERKAHTETKKRLQN